MVLGSALPGFAQADDDLSAIEEIVVTAERREQSLQNVAQAVSAFSLDDLNEQNIQDLYDLQMKVPGLVSTGGLVAVTLRGIGQDTDVLGPGIDPGFQLHINDIYATQVAVAVLGFYDLERVEVLPGPQGTLYGRNSTGGSMNFHTKKPVMDEWGWSGDVDYASFDNLRVRGTFNIPLIDDTLAARVAFVREWPPKPYEVRGANGHKQDLSNNALSGGLSIRASLRWTPTEDVTTDFIFQWTRDNDNGGTQRMLDRNESFEPGQSALFGGVNYAGSSLLPDDTRDHLANDRHSQRYETIWGQAILEWDLDGHILKLNGNYQYWDFGVDFDWDMSDVDAERLELFDKHVAFTAEATIRSDYDGPFSWIFGGNYQEDSAPNTEVPIFDPQQKAAASSYLLLDLLTFGSSKETQRYCGPAAIPGLDCLFTGGDPDEPFLFAESGVDTETVGVFFDASYDITEQLRISGGIRYSYTDREMRDTGFFDITTEALDIITDENTCGGGFTPFFPNTPVGVSQADAACWDAVFLPLGLSRSSTAFLIPLKGNLDINTLNLQTVTKHKSWNSITWRARLEWRPDEDNLFYAGVSTGERHGGFDFFVNEPFDSEEILAYEVGSKSTLLDGHLIFNTSFFFYDYEDRFISETIDNIEITTNVGETEVLGAEFQLTWAPEQVEGLLISGQAGWLDAEIQSDFLVQDNSAQEGVNTTGFCSFKPVGDQHGFGPTCDGALLQNLNGNVLPRAPKWSFTVAVEYAIPFAGGSLIPRASLSWRDEIYFRQFENSLDRQASFHRTDLRLRWEPNEGGYWIEGYVQNLENEKEIKTQVETSGVRRHYWLAMPRVFGIRAGFEFSADTLSGLLPFGS